MIRGLNMINQHRDEDDQALASSQKESDVLSDVLENLQQVNRKSRARPPAVNPRPLMSIFDFWMKKLDYDEPHIMKGQNTSEFNQESAPAMTKLAEVTSTAAVDMLPKSATETNS